MFLIISFVFLQLFSLILHKTQKHTDPSTLSNYGTVTISNLRGIFNVNFERKIIEGNITFLLHSEEQGEEIIFDSKKLEVLKIFDCLNRTELPFDFGEESEALGRALIIKKTFGKNESLCLNILYETKEEGNAVSFLSKEQTMGKEYPMVFTHCEMILAREMMPCQDSPSVKC